MKGVNMMKSSPKTDERNDKTKTTDVEFLEPLFEEKTGKGRNTSNRMETFSMKLEPEITEEQQPPKRMETLETTHPPKKTAKDPAPTMEKENGSSASSKKKDNKK